MIRLNRCDPVGFIRQILQNPLPMKIERYDDRVVFRYEYWDSVRTAYMDGRDHPADLMPSRLGHSIGWYDEETLVIETRGVARGLYANFIVDSLTTSPRTLSRATRHAMAHR